MSNEKRFKQSKKFAERALSTWSKWSPFCPYTTKVPFRKELQKIFEMYEKTFIQVKKSTPIVLQEKLKCFKSTKNDKANLHVISEGLFRHWLKNDFSRVFRAILSFLLSSGLHNLYSKISFSSVALILEISILNLFAVCNTSSSKKRNEHFQVFGILVLKNFSASKVLEGMKKLE